MKRLAVHLMFVVCALFVYSCTPDFPEPVVPVQANEEDPATRGLTNPFGVDGAFDESIVAGTLYTPAFESGGVYHINKNYYFSYTPATARSGRTYGETSIGVRSESGGTYTMQSSSGRFVSMYHQFTSRGVYYAKGNIVTTWTSGGSTKYGEESQSRTFTVIDPVDPLNGGNIGASPRSIRFGIIPPAFTGAASGGAGSYYYKYQWQSSTNGTSWTNISGATSSYYQPSAMTANTYYRRQVTAGSQTAYSNPVLYQVQNTVFFNIDKTMMMPNWYIIYSIDGNLDPDATVEWDIIQGEEMWNDTYGRCLYVYCPEEPFKGVSYQKYLIVKGRITLNGVTSNWSGDSYVHLDYLIP